MIEVTQFIFKHKDFPKLVAKIEADNFAVAWAIAVEIMACPRNWVLVDGSK